MLTSQCRQPRCRLKTCNALVALRAHLLGVALSTRDIMVACCGRVKNERTPITLREEGYAKGMKEARRRYADVPDISIVTSSADCGDQQQRPICRTGSNM
jgi:hypothetical protein